MNEGNRIGIRAGSGPHDRMSVVATSQEKGELRGNKKERELSADCRKLEAKSRIISRRLLY